jgi:RNA polymerase sigma factor (sigma-70 family)
MSGSEASVGRQRYAVRYRVPNSCYAGMRFGPFSVGEPDCARPPRFSRLLQSLMRKGRSREDAEDLIQEALLHLHVFAQGHVVINEEAFLRHAVHNLAIDQYRHDRFRLSQEVPIEEVEREGPLIASGPTPDQILDSQQRLEELTVLLEAVSPRTREIYIANQYGYSRAEIADEMGIAEITVHRHMRRALATIPKKDD